MLLLKGHHFMKLKKILLISLLFGGLVLSSCGTSNPANPSTNQNDGSGNVNNNTDDGSGEDGGNTNNEGDDVSGNTNDNNEGNNDSGNDNHDEPINNKKVTYKDQVYKLANKVDKIPEIEKLFGKATKNALKNIKKSEESNDSENDIETFTEPSEGYKKGNAFNWDGGQYYEHYDFCVSVAKSLKEVCLLKCDYLNKWTADESNNCKYRINYDSVYNELYIEAIQSSSNGTKVGKSYQYAKFSFNGEGKAVIDFEWHFPKFEVYGVCSTYYYAVHYVEDDYVTTEDYRYICTPDENGDLYQYQLINATAYVDLKEEANITAIRARVDENVETKEKTNFWIEDAIRIQKIGNYITILDPRDFARLQTYDLTGKKVFNLITRYPYESNCNIYVELSLYECLLGWDKFEVTPMFNDDGWKRYDDSKLYIGDLVINNYVQNGCLFEVRYDLYERPFFIIEEYRKIDEILETTGLSLKEGIDPLDTLEKAVSSASNGYLFGMDYKTFSTMSDEAYLNAIYHEVKSVEELIEVALAKEDNPIPIEQVYQESISVSFEAKFEEDEDDEYGIVLSNILLTDETKQFFSNVTDAAAEIVIGSDCENRLVISSVRGKYENGIISFEDIETNLKELMTRSYDDGEYILSIDFTINSKMIAHQSIDISEEITKTIKKTEYIEYKSGVVIKSSNIVLDTNGTIKISVSSSYQDAYYINYIVDDELLDTVLAISNTDIDLPILEKEGYVFEGWYYLDSDYLGNDVPCFVEGPYHGSENVNLYASFKEETSGGEENRDDDESVDDTTDASSNEDEGDNN